MRTVPLYSLIFRRSEEDKMNLLTIMMTIVAIGLLFTLLVAAVLYLINKIPDQTFASFERKLEDAADRIL